MNWVDVLQAIISGVVVGLVVFGLDVLRAFRERKLSDFRIAANWETVTPKVSLRSFYLRDANLSGMNLSTANLEDANLQSAGLWATDLSGANLRGANLIKTELIGTNFAKANVTDADFSRSIIRRHNYPDLNCVTDFSSATLIKCNFQKATIEEANFREADLKRSKFNGASVVGCDFTGADFTDSIWKNVKRVEKCTWKDVKGVSSENFPSDLLKEIQRQNAM